MGPSAIVTNWRSFPLLAAVLVGQALVPEALPAAPVAVRYPEGVVHGFVALSTLDGTKLADGDLIQVARGDRVTSRLVFHFRDGSVHDETTVFAQRGRFRLLEDHLVQKGPAFPHPLDVSIEVPKGTVTVRFTEDDGRAQVRVDRLKLSGDLANGMLPILLKNLPAGAGLAVPLVATTPKARLVTIVATPSGEDEITIGGSSRRAVRYLIKVEIGGVAGVVAPLVGKQPPESHVWILPGEAPTFVRSESAFYQGGPLWRIDLQSPTWPRQP